MGRTELGPMATWIVRMVAGFSGEAGWTGSGGGGLRAGLSASAKVTAHLTQSSFTEDQ